MKSVRRPSSGALYWIAALSVTVLSCNLDTTAPDAALRFAPAWQLQTIDGQPLPDTLALVLENSQPGTLHKVESGSLEFVFPRGSAVLRWTLTLLRLTDNQRFAFSFDAMYDQFGADSIVFPRTRGVPAEFYGGKRGDTLIVNSIWSGDSTTAALLVGGSHKWRFQRDTSIH